MIRVGFGGIWQYSYGSYIEELAGMGNDSGFYIACFLSLFDKLQPLAMFRCQIQNALK